MIVAMFIFETVSTSIMFFAVLYETLLKNNYVCDLLTVLFANLRLKS